MLYKLWDYIFTIVSELSGFKFFVHQGVCNLVESLVEIGSIRVVDIWMFIVHQLGIGPHSAGLPVTER